MTPSLHGIRALVTAGPTRERLDPVRYLSNFSSGKQGYALADALAAKGAEVTLVSGPVTLPTPAGVRRIDTESAEEMYRTCLDLLPVDIAICTAAVADWRPEHYSPQKQKKQGKAEHLPLTLVRNPDILQALSVHKNRPRLVIGFAAETESLTLHAREKLLKKGCDWLFANSVADGAVFGKDATLLWKITRKNEEEWPEMTKRAAAERIAHEVAGHFLSLPSA